MYYVCVKRDPDAKVKTLSTSIVVFELVLSAVATVIFKTFACTEFDDGDYLEAQLNLKCDDSASRQRWYAYAICASVVYALIVPISIFVVLGLLRKDTLQDLLDLGQLGVQWVVLE